MKQLCRGKRNADSKSYSIPLIRNCGAYMRDIKQKISSTDKRMKNALVRSVWLSYLLSLGTITSGGLSFFSVVTILGLKPAQANVKQPSVNLPEQTFEEQQTLSNSFDSFISKIPSQSTENNSTSIHDTPELGNDTQWDSVTKSGQEAALVKITESKSSDKLALGDLSTSIHDTPEFANDTLSDSVTKSGEEVALLKIASSTTKSGQEAASVKITESKSSDKLALGDLSTSIHDTPEFAENTLTDSTTKSGEEVVPLKVIESKAPEKLALGDKFNNLYVIPKFADNSLASSTTKSGEEAVPLKVIESKAPEQKTQSLQPSTVLPASTLKTTVKVENGIYKGPGAAALLLSNSPTPVPQQIAQQPVPPTRQDNPFAPSVVFQGAYVYQGDSSARARLTGIYPVSPNALFGGTVDLGTGPDFSDSQAGSLRISELYFTGSLPSFPSLRMTVGLVDLTSYFDRNSFAKDVTTHFFNPVFQTNPALAMTGIGSRPAALLNWNITDNLEAKAAVFSSAQSIGDLGLNGFAGELGFRHGNGIIRATYASDRDVDKNGFKEIYGLKRKNGEIGPRSSDRESSYGINGEYFIPGLKMGLFGRYGRYENTSLGKGGNTYSVGLNFLDLFMRDDRFGLGYGRDLSNDDLRRQTGKKVPDVWEAFYDFRISPIIRAGVTLQAREQFSDIVAGFRVKTEFDVTSLLGGRK